MILTVCDYFFKILAAVAKGDDDGIMVDIYDNVQDELRAMKKRYEREVKKVWDVKSRMGGSFYYQSTL